MIDNRANVNLTASNGNGWTPLCYAAQADAYELIPILVSAGADIKARTKGGLTALEIANRFCHTNTRRVILSELARHISLK